jgi:4-amino-4-deoxy-L-arabinose transferase-like glycosyltransferase
MAANTMAGTLARAGRDTQLAKGEGATPQPDSTINKRLLYASLFLVAFGLRYGFVLWKHTYLSKYGNILPFGAEICSIAQRIAEGRGFSSPFFVETGPTAWVAPVYPYLMALLFRIFGVWSAASALAMITLQCLMAAGNAIAIYALGRRMFGSKVALWAAWIWAVSPIFFRWPVSWIWDFAASALLVSVALILTLDVAEKGTWQRWLGLGAIWALIALTNPAPISIMPFSFLYAAYRNYKAGAKWIAPFVYSAALFTVLVSPWLIRNYVVFHQPVFFRSNYWFEFHLGNYHYSNGIGFSGKHPNNNPRVLVQYEKWGEARFIDYYKKDAVDFVRKYPGEYLDLTLHRTWWFWDGSTLNYYGNPEWWVPWKFWPLSLLAWAGFIFVLTRRPRGWILFAAVLLIYPIPYYLAYPGVRYRHAIEPEMLLMSVYLAAVLWGEVAGLFAPKRLQSQNPN